MEICVRFNFYDNFIIVDKKKVLLFYFYKWENLSLIIVWFI